MRPRPAPGAPHRGAHQRSVHPSIRTLTSLGTLFAASVDRSAAARARPRGLFSLSRPEPSSTYRKAHHGGPPAAPALREPSPSETASWRRDEPGRDQASVWPRCPSSPLPSAAASPRPPAPPPPWAQRPARRPVANGDARAPATPTAPMPQRTTTTSAQPNAATSRDPTVPGAAHPPAPSSPAPRGDPAAATRAQRQQPGTDTRPART